MSLPDAAVILAMGLLLVDFVLMGIAAGEAFRGLRDDKVMADKEAKRLVLEAEEHRAKFHRDAKEVLAAMPYHPEDEGLFDVR